MPATRPQDYSFTTRAPLRVSATRIVDASPHRVFDRLADARSWRRWFPGMVACWYLTRPPHGVGSVRRVWVGPLRVDDRFIVWEPGRRWGFTFESTNLPWASAGVEVVDLEETDDGRTRVTYRMSLEPRGPMGALLRRRRTEVGRALAGALAGLDADLRRR